MSNIVKFLFLLVLVTFAAQKAYAEMPPVAHPQRYNPDEIFGQEAIKLLMKAKEHAASDYNMRGVKLLPTSDGKSFIVVWHEGEKAPDKWLVSLHGSNGYATRDLEVWLPALKGRNIGFIGIQWWLGTGDKTEDYYRPNEIYRELDKALAKLGVKPNSALLQGFSRGSANVYAVAAFDRANGQKYFSTVIASSGGAALDYLPTADVNSGKFGEKPFAGTKWITSCGERDENPERDGCPAMQRTALWLEKMGADVILQIEDKQGAHGALNTNIENAKKAIDLYLKH